MPYHIKYKFDEKSFETLSDSSAYWLGILFADGYINWETFAQPQLVFGLKDKDHLEKYKSFLKSDHTILKQTCRTKIKKDGTFPITWRINVNSRKMCEDIKKYGFEEENPCEMLMDNRHFWRGFIDGDGSLFEIKGKLYLSAVGKYEILEKFKLFVIARIKNINPSINKHKSIFDLGFGTWASRELAEILYKDSPEDHRLERKYIIYKKYENEIFKKQ